VERIMTETAQYLTLGLDGETFGIGIRNVREILDLRPISKIPHAPDFLLGMIDVRGSSYPVVDLRTKLDLPKVPATEATRIIILDVPMADRSVGVGFVADCVYEVTGIDENQIEPPPSVGGRWKSDYLAGIGRKQDGFVIIFDLAKLMASSDLVQDEPPAASVAA
jgi:purine-binding chemotaxis protein CheW